MQSLKTRFKLIGICGAIGSGKDTVGDYLVKQHGFKRMSFAYHLKRMVIDIFQLKDQVLFGTQEEKAAPVEKFGAITSWFERLGPPWDKRVGDPWSGRYLAEFVGTECFRSVYAPVWIERAMADVLRDRAEALELGGKGGVTRHVFTDPRFLNEADAIRRAGGEVWRTIRTDRQTENTGHISDQEWRRIVPDYDLKAVTGAIPYLHEQAKDLLGHSGVGLGQVRRLRQ